MKYAIGIDLGGTSVKFAVINEQGEILFSDKLPTHANEGADVVLEQIIKSVNLCIAYAKGRGFSLEGVGIGTPGVVSEDFRIVIGGAENIIGWENIPLAQRVEAKCNLPVFANNDANMMACGESLYGAAVGDKDVVFITVGTGIGGALLINGELYRGYKNRGMELGHITIQSDGESCACGGVGCLEHYASTSALVNQFHERCVETGTQYESIDGERIVALYKAGDPIAIEIMDRHWDYLSHGIASMINLFSPKKIVIGGGISESGEFYFENLRKKSLPLAMDVCREGTEIIGALLGNQAGSLGAAGFVFSQLK